LDIYDYTTAGGKNLIMDYIDALPAATKAEILASRQLIQEKGIEAFSLLVTRQLFKKLWEIKISQERIMYVIQDQDSVYFLNICKKQKGKAEKQELEKAKNAQKRRDFFKRRGDEDGICKSGFSAGERTIK
jgi:phage-related protein